MAMADDDLTWPSSCLRLTDASIACNARRVRIASRDMTPFCRLVLDRIPSTRNGRTEADDMP